MERHNCVYGKKKIIPQSVTKPLDMATPHKCTV